MIEERAVRQANPLIGDRGQAEKECLRLVELIVKGDPQKPDPIDVMSMASEFKGFNAVNPASMSDDWLAHTLVKLRKWLRRLNGEADMARPPMLADERPAMDDGMVKRIAERRRLAEANPRRPGESPEDHRRRLDALLGAQ